MSDNSLDLLLHSEHTALVYIHTVCVRDTESDRKKKGVSANRNRKHTCVCANVCQEGHGVAALAHLSTIFTHTALVLLALAVDLLCVLQHILVDLPQKLLVFLLDVKK